MALGTVVTIDTPTVTLPTDLTNGLFTSDAITLSSDYAALQITWADIAGDYPTIFLKVSNDGTNYVDLERPVDYDTVPVKYVIHTEDGGYAFPVSGLDFAYVKVLIYAKNATAGTITIDLNY